jgi:adenylate cyclase
VIAATTSAAFASNSRDIPEIARELGVRYILKGAVQKAGGKLRINAQLVEGATAVQLWSDRFDGDEANLFELQDRITARIANSIGREIAVALALEAEARTSNPLAADFLIRGVAISNKPQSLETLREQEHLFKNVLALEPENAEAWARLARALLLQVINFVFPLRPDQLDDNLRDARKAVEKALRFGPNNARSYLAEGFCIMHSAIRGRVHEPMKPP